LENSHLRPVLLVEDTLSDIELTKRAFKVANILNPLQVVESGEEALDFLFYRGSYAGRTPVQPALILLDVNMPGMNGIEVLRAIRENAKTTRLLVVMLTSSDEDRDRIASYELHVNSYLRKPVDFVRFTETVKMLGMYWLLLNEPVFKIGEN
jgi:two-component system response regulator